jgi:hypothetical protein
MLKLLAFLALMAMSSAGIADDCPISDWPLDLPQGQAAMVQVMRPAAATVVTRMVHNSASSAAAQQRSMGMAPTAPANPHLNPPRDWRGLRAAAPTDQQRLMYAVMDGDVAGVKKYMKSPQVRVNAPLNSNTRLGLLDFAVQGALPDVARALIDGGAHVRPEPGDDIDVYPVYTAVSSLNTICTCAIGRTRSSTGLRCPPSTSWMPSGCCSRRVPIRTLRTPRSTRRWAS